MYNAAVALGKTRTMWQVAQSKLSSS